MYIYHHLSVLGQGYQHFGSDFEPSLRIMTSKNVNNPYDWDSTTNITMPIHVQLTTDPFESGDRYIEIHIASHIIISGLYIETPSYVF